MMVAVLLGALSLGACVDDNESASVTAIRDAQAKKIAALAELYSNQAEAELIAANADAALKAAQAKYQEAMANYQQAMADETNVRVEEARWQLQKAQEEYNRYLEQAEIEAQTALLKAQIELQRQQQVMAGLVDEQLNGLYADYTQKANALLEMRMQLNQQNNLLAQYNANLITEKAVIEQQTNQYNVWIANATAQRDAYANYEGYDQAELSAQMTQLSNEIYYAVQNALQKETAKLDAQSAYIDALSPYYYHNVEEDDETALAYLKAIRTLSAYVSTPTENVDLFEFEVGNSTYSGSMVKYLAPDEINVLTARQQLARDLRKAEEQLGEEGVPATETTPAVDPTGLYWDLAYWEDLLEAEQDKDYPDQDLIDSYTLEVAYAERDIDKQIELIEEIEANQKAFEDALTAIATEANVTAYEAALDALKENEAVLAYAAAWQEEEEAWATRNELSSEYSVISNLYYNSVNAEEEIARLNVDIANWEAQRDQLSTVNTDNLILQVEANIDQLENQIAAQEEIVKIAKDNLDEAIKAQGGSEEQPAA